MSERDEARRAAADLIEEARDHVRQNFALLDNKHYVCDGDHDRSTGCEWRPLTESDVLNMLNRQQALTIHLEDALRREEELEREIYEKDDYITSLEDDIQALEREAD